MLVVDSNQENLNELIRLAKEDTVTAANIANGKLKFECADLTNMPLVCKQSTVDAIVDYLGIDFLHTAPTGKDGILRCIDQLMRPVTEVLLCIRTCAQLLFLLVTTKLHSRRLPDTIICLAK